MIEEKICQLCGNKFRGWHAAKYCNNCRPIANRLRSARSYQRQKLCKNDKIGVTVRLCERCGEKFVITNSMQKFCPACCPLHTAEKNRQKKLRQWATNKDFRERRKKYLKEYYQKKKGEKKII